MTGVIHESSTDSVCSGQVSQPVEMYNETHISLSGHDKSANRAMMMTKWFRGNAYALWYLNSLPTIYLTGAESSNQFWYYIRQRKPLSGMLDDLLLFSNTQPREGLLSP
jgi:hypothetical protein